MPLDEGRQRLLAPTLQLILTGLEFSLATKRIGICVAEFMATGESKFDVDAAYDELIAAKHAFEAKLERRVDEVLAVFCKIELAKRAGTPPSEFVLTDNQFDAWKQRANAKRSRRLRDAKLKT